LPAGGVAAAANALSSGFGAPALGDVVQSAAAPPSSIGGTGVSIPGVVPEVADVPPTSAAHSHVVIGGEVLADALDNRREQSADNILEQLLGGVRRTLYPSRRMLAHRVAEAPCWMRRTYLICKSVRPRVYPTNIWRVIV